jgi:YVTN family beta-propeller protein
MNFRRTSTGHYSIAGGPPSLDVAITPDGTAAYVTNADSDNVSVIDTATHIKATIKVGRSPLYVWRRAAAINDEDHCRSTIRTTPQPRGSETARHRVYPAQPAIPILYYIYCMMLWLFRSGAVLSATVNNM